VGAPAEIPHADEELKSLVVRFKEAPGSSAFTELAAALLVRGHAAEALRIAEHGLQIVPQNVDGRIERAAALLALGRPRVAYVELKRALAISPTNRRAMRLLGKVYVDVGAPSRAAELLAQRFKHGEGIEENEAEPTHVTQAPFPFADAQVEGKPPAYSVRADTEPLRRKDQPIPSVPAREDRRDAKLPPSNPALGAQTDPLQRKDTPIHKTQTPLPKKEGAIPDLFSDLTRDLGLGVPAAEAPQSRVEVTQVIRRRGVRPRSPSELATIEGPIVDTTQPGQIQEVSSDISVPAHGHEPPPLFDAVTSPRLQLAPFGLDDEPLFQEHMPFAVRPVGDKDAVSDDGDLRETIDEEAPPELDSALMRAAIEGGPNTTSPGGPPGFAKSSSRTSFSEGGDTLVDQLEESDGPEKLPTSVTSAPAPAPLGVREKNVEPADHVRFEGGMPLLEVSRPSRRAMVAPRLELVVPKSNPIHLGLAIAGGLFMLVYLVFLLLEAPHAWRPNLSLLSEDTQGHAAPVVERSTEARSSRE
jgi:hypothetical protein